LRELLALLEIIPDERLLALALSLVVPGSPAHARASERSVLSDGAIKY
jgi:hypothetical protein